MSRDLRKLSAELAQLTATERAELARTLIDSLDDESEADVEQLWIAEAHRRYDAYLRGEIASTPAEEVFARIRRTLRK